MSDTDRLTAQNQEEKNYFNIVRFDKRQRRLGNPIQIQRERMMMKRLTFLKTKLQWCTAWGRDKKVQAQNELALRLRMWGTIGYLKY